MEQIMIGTVFQPINWKAAYDMDFSLDCLYCGHPTLSGYHVEDERGKSKKVVVCGECFKVNGNYS
ncbi:hypothetical protein L1765_09065 [Microaerobacter geothermalis]|uniref:hypothetical protein n=1 Tax=Microaerobacter geothermalis TaxID=674972 RepID=UPI001F16B81C|nr:hypothetical protein [Microaerobacter geothermalis]MCF6094111.1 hypothetical protein [Microaerobacter geothermalis]